MASFGKITLSIPRVIGLILVLEGIRELFVLNALGFQPDRFVDWLRGGSDGAR